MYNGTNYYWCHHHGLWTLTKHTEETCYLMKKEAQKNNISEEGMLPKDGKASASQMPNNQLVAFATKLQQVMEE